MDDSDIVDFVVGYRTRHGYSPSEAEIAEHAGVSRPAVRKRLQRLRREGVIVVTPGKRRTIRTSDAKGESWPM